MQSNERFVYFYNVNVRESYDKSYDMTRVKRVYIYMITQFKIKGQKI